jgi:hypothetical protein
MGQPNVKASAKLDEAVLEDEFKMKEKRAFAKYGMKDKFKLELGKDSLEGLKFDPT